MICGIRWLNISKIPISLTVSHCQSHRHNLKKKTLYNISITPHHLNILQPTLARQGTLSPSSLNCMVRGARIHLIFRATMAVVARPKERPRSGVDGFSFPGSIVLIFCIIWIITPDMHVRRQKFMSGIFSFMSGICPTCRTPNGAPAQGGACYMPALL